MPNENKNHPSHETHAVNESEIHIDDQYLLDETVIIPFHQAISELAQEAPELISDFFPSEPDSFGGVLKDILEKYTNQIHTALAAKHAAEANHANQLRIDARLINELQEISQDLSSRDPEVLQYYYENACDLNSLVTDALGRHITFLREILAYRDEVSLDDDFQ